MGWNKVLFLLLLLLLLLLLSSENWLLNILSPVYFRFIAKGNQPNLYSFRPFSSRSNN